MDEEDAEDLPRPRERAGGLLILSNAKLKSWRRMINERVVPSVDDADQIDVASGNSSLIYYVIQDTLFTINFRNWPHFL